MIAKLHHQIDATVKVLQNVKNTFTFDLTKQLNKIFNNSIIQMKLNTHYY
ncbi:predicted protein [Histoplasma mississippiense (nom. inval.)]|nr:predicted protein [Histoplasma mississippiense (nom. inval.)]EDN05093.1 predicted protein [Histoplasma mississippiense (nom. inval.)]